MDGDEHIDLFVSYARSDRSRVTPMIAALEAQGWRVFWDHDIPPGWTWDEYIGARLEQSPVVLVVWSRTAVTSEFVRTEAARARKRRAMVPVRIDEVDPPVEFERVHSADLIEWVRAPEGALPQALVQEIRRRVTPRPVGQVPTMSHGGAPLEQPTTVADRSHNPDATPKAMAELQDKLRQSEAVRETLTAELTGVRQALGEAGRTLDDRQRPQPTSRPASTSKGKTPWRWSDLDIGGRVGFVLGGALVAFLVVKGMIGAFR